MQCWADKSCHLIPAWCVAIACSCTNDSHHRSSFIMKRQFPIKWGPMDTVQGSWHTTKLATNVGTVTTKTPKCCFLIVVNICLVCAHIWQEQIRSVKWNSNFQKTVKRLQTILTSWTHISLTIITQLKAYRSAPFSITYYNDEVICFMNKRTSETI